MSCNKVPNELQWNCKWVATKSQISCNGVTNELQRNYKWVAMELQMSRQQVAKLINWVVAANTTSSQSLEPTICQQLSCGYCCFMGSHVNYNLSHHCDALLYNLSHRYDALLKVQRWNAVI